ncbi:VCBS repeat-containing protein [Clostridium sp. YIM B02565]|uniref:VCBS repeat-containing protein n=2 Tax=Clostridium paridis TaxID=2803863 RepID=A0A937K3G5_9CLOT|nr:VCBS repeat-containing protein [Clostridium paridis]
MKLRVLFIHKKQIFFLLMFLILCFISVILFNLFSQKEYGDSLSVFAKEDYEKGLKKDLNGDGKEDVINITTKDDKYYVGATINNKSYMLSPDTKLASLGKEYPNWGIRLFMKDISRDGIPEIFLQSSQEDTAISHIFSWTGLEFKDYFYSTNNVMGILNSQNNKTPKFFSGKVVDGLLTFDSYMLIGNNFKNTSYDQYTVPGRQSVTELIDAIEAASVPYELPSFFCNSTTESDAALLWKLDKNVYSYKFQDAFFLDDKWDKNGDITSIIWQINFKRTNKSTSKNDSIIIKAKVIPSNKDYKVSSVSLYEK